MKIRINGNDLYTVTSNFGEIGKSHITPHTGIDFAMETGTKLFSPVDGTVTKVVDFGSENIGKGVYIETSDHHTVIMGHLSEAKVKVGQQLHEGDLVAYSGNTGHSTGSHLHLGLKDADGTFINPKVLTSTDTTGATSNGLFGGVKDSWNDFTGFMDFLGKVKEQGFFHALYGKSFFEVTKDFFSQLGHDIGMFLLNNADIFFLAPAILIMFGTFIVGNNKYAKYILPLWFGYFVTTVLSKILQ